MIEIQGQIASIALDAETVVFGYAAISKLLDLHSTDGRNVGHVNDKVRRGPGARRSGDCPVR